MDSTKILYAEEVKDVLKYLLKYSSQSMLRRRVTFRLSCCCGLRRCEIAGVNLNDFTTEGPRPVIRIRKEIAKNKKARLVPLWWDSGTLADLKLWKNERTWKGAAASDPFLTTRKGDRPSESQVYRYWKACLKPLHEERRKQLPCHAGRHSFATHALLSGRSLMEVRDALGHSSIQTTSIYAHAIPTDVRDIFG